MKAEKKEILRSVLETISKGWLKDLHEKETSNLVKYDKYVVLKEKKSLEKYYCYGYGYGKDYNEALDEVREAQTNVNVFIETNMQAINEEIEKYQNARNIYLVRRYEDNEHIADAYCENDVIKIAIDRGVIDGKGSEVGFATEIKKCLGVVKTLTAEEKQQYIDMLLEERDKQRKRIDTYLKKYGLSKIKVWSFCTED